MDKIKELEKENEILEQENEDLITDLKMIDFYRKEIIKLQNRNQELESIIQDIKRT